MKWRNLSIIALTLLVFSFVYINYSTNELKADTNFLMSSLELNERLMKDKESIVILDIRKAKQYKKEHLPAALNIWRPQIQSKNYEYGGMRSEKEHIKRLFRSLGIKKDQHIVLYDGKGSADAVRLWWILYQYGNRNMSVLNGGIVSWKKIGFDVSTETKTVFSESKFEFENDTYKTKFIGIEDIKLAINDTNIVLLDTRSLKEFTGEKLKKGAFRAGRIPTSIHYDWGNSVRISSSEDHTFKSIKDLRYMLEKLGVTPDKTIYTYCQSGVRSAHTKFVLTELLDFKNVYNYDGSWIEWSYHKELPIETGVL